jgi:hypothetical protein
MSARLSRKRFVIAGIITTLFTSAASVWAIDQHVIEFTSPPAIAAGSNLLANVSVNQAPMNVHITSNPPGLVNQTVTLNSTSATVSVPTDAGAPAGSYQLVATPVGGGGSQVRVLQAQAYNPSNNGNQ